MSCYKKIYAYNKINEILSLNYQNEIKAKTLATIGKKEMAVERNAEKLLSHCCGLNIINDGADPPLLQKSDCPDWLYDMDCSQETVRLEDLDPESEKYWSRVKKLAVRRKSLLERSRPRILRDPSEMHIFNYNKKK